MSLRPLANTVFVYVVLLLVHVCESSVFLGDPCKTVVEGNVEFATSVLSRYYEEEWVYSPLGFFVLYSLVYIGAKGKTAQELADVLHLPNEPDLVKQGLHDMMHSNDTMNANMPFENAIFVDENCPVKSEFRKEASEIFRAGIKTVNFSSENMKNEFNSWVSNASGIVDYTSNLLTPPVENQLSLVNSARFHGTWLYKFKHENTRPMPFTAFGSFTKHVKMMHVEAPFKLVKNDFVGARILEMPFEEPDNPVGFIIILPYDVDGLSQVQARLQEASLLEIMDMSNVSATPLNLFVPKFEASSRLDFVDELSKEFDLSEVFGNRSDLSGLSDTPVSLITFYQETEVEVTEDGTVASAVTSPFVASRIMEAEPDHTLEKFVVDHPFFYMIRCANTGNILFMGKCPDPSGE